MVCVPIALVRRASAACLAALLLMAPAWSAAAEMVADSGLWALAAVGTPSPPGPSSPAPGWVAPLAVAVFTVVMLFVIRHYGRDDEAADD